jgi:hypothetical protein
MTTFDDALGTVRSMMIRNLFIFDLDIPLKVLVRRTLELAYPRQVQVGLLAMAVVVVPQYYCQWYPGRNVTAS